MGRIATVLTGLGLAGTLLAIGIPAALAGENPWRPDYGAALDQRMAQAPEPARPMGPVYPPADGSLPDAARPAAPAMTMPPQVLVPVQPAYGGYGYGVPAYGYGPGAGYGGYPGYGGSGYPGYGAGYGYPGFGGYGFQGFNDRWGSGGWPFSSFFW